MNYLPRMATEARAMTTDDSVASGIKLAATYVR